MTQESKGGVSPNNQAFSAQQERRIANYLQGRKNRIRKISYHQTLTETEQLTIQTCPGYNEALDRALLDTYHEKKCRDCRVEVSVEAAIDRIDIWGKCPKT
ncbi:MAG TPA: hypothetical protein VMR59_04760 [Patescibacteria group bacterium]|jgi:uncharacterized protein YlaN (UPF0358 family)|nr:hypothetical protein [Patescibacteria group bacterium]